MTTNELTSPEAVEKLAAQYDDVGLRDDELVTATLRALSAENKRLRASLVRIRTLAGMVAHDLVGRVEGGKVAAVQQCADVARAALNQETFNADA